MSARLVRCMLLASLMLMSCDQPETTTASRSGAGARVVRMTTIQPQPWRHTLRVSGIIESEWDVLLAAAVAGRVAERVTEPGALVKSGTVIVRLDDTEFRLARDLAKVAVEEAAVNSAVPAEERRARGVRLELAEERLARCEVRALRSGTVESVLVDPGEWVSPGVPVARIVDQADLRLVIRLADDEVVLVEADQDVTFRVDALGPRNFSATVEQIGSVPDASGRYLVEARIPAESTDLFCGLFANVRLPVGDATPTLVLPREAVSTRWEQPFCFVVQDGKAVERRVEVAAIPGEPSRTRILSGLEPGEIVLIGPLSGITDGVAVTAAKGRDR